MAKSLRSKWRRKCRAVKRERNGKKELDRLQKMIDEKGPAALKNLSSVVKRTRLPRPDSMDIEPNPSPVFDPKTKRNKNGNYPVWMKRKEIQKIQQRNRRTKPKHKKTKKVA